MKRYDNPISFWIFFIKFKTCAWTERSRAETGSSAMISLGFKLIALATPILCLWPPENSNEYLYSASPGIPTISKSSKTLFLSSVTVIFSKFLRGSAIMSITLFLGSKLAILSWKIIWTSLVNSLSFLTIFLVRVFPSKITSPLVIFSRPIMAFPIVLLPLPLSPISP